jgi:phosphate uptake regulator
MTKSGGVFSKQFWTRFVGIFTDESLPEQMDDHFTEMLKLGEEMYVSVTAVLLDPESNTLERIRESFFATDQRINALEQRIRRNVLVHLSIQQERSPNLTQHLMMLNQVKDAERIGDYTKNIFEVFEYAANSVTGEYLDNFSRLRSRTIGLFSEIRTALTNLDAKLAKKACNDCTRYIKECTTVIYELMESPDNVANPVANALLFRYQKRILSHLRKIATAQFAPFDKFGTCGKDDPSEEE